MNDRIDQYLAGDVPWDLLTPDEREEAAAFARAVTETRDVLGRPAPDVTAAVMQRVAQLGAAAAGRPSLARRLWITLWTPRPIHLRPAYALAAAVVLVLALAPLSRPSPDEPASMALPAGPLFVQFRLHADAMRVQLAGTFTNWEPRYDMHEVSPGIWTLTIPLSQGVHDYAFVVDGERWVADPVAPSIGDGFGGTNSRLTLLLPEAPHL